MALRRGTWGIASHPIEARLETVLALGFLLTAPELCFGPWPWDRVMQRSDLVEFMMGGTLVVGLTFLFVVSILIFVAALRFPRSASVALSRIRRTLVGFELRPVREILRALDALEWRIDREARLGNGGTRAMAESRRALKRLTRRALSLAIRSHDPATDAFGRKVTDFARTQFLVAVGVFFILAVRAAPFGDFYTPTLRLSASELLALAVSVGAATPILLLFGAGALVVYRRLVRWPNGGTECSSEPQATAIEAVFAGVLMFVAATLCYSRLSSPRVILDAQVPFDVARLFVTRVACVAAFSVFWTLRHRGSIHAALARKLQGFAVVVATLSAGSAAILAVAMFTDRGPWFMVPLGVPFLVGFWMLPTLFVFGGISSFRRALTWLVPRPRRNVPCRSPRPDAEGIEELAREIEKAIDSAVVPARMEGALSVCEHRGSPGALSIQSGGRLSISGADRGSA
ncbi:MAG: hypothetical protein HY791_19605 [Deltaproteobacteria bacterium]|nr:hypothetical protein [Deltaproteobacteria bacterium]